jgi:hypothetical protein
MLDAKHKPMRTTALLFLLLAASAHAADAWHTFTDRGGRTMVAAIVKVESTYAILKLKANGREVTLGFDKLSEEDVDFLNSYDPGDAPGKAGETAEDTATEEEPEVGRLYPRSKEEIRKTIREIKGLPRPEGISREVHEATQTLNIYRYLCGVPYKVESDATFSANAEQAALACEKHGGLSHDIGSFTDKCNLYSGGDMIRSVSAYIEDSGANNRERRGHRAWCLNPPMEKVGFGSGKKGYSAMWCMDSGGKPIRGTWAYPGKGLFPLDYMHGDAWSVYGIDVPDSIDKVEVRVFKLSSRPEKPFSATADIPGREIPVKYVSKGMMRGINFEPEEPAKRGIYWITIRGGGIRESYLVELY